MGKDIFMKDIFGDVDVKVKVEVHFENEVEVARAECSGRLMSDAKEKPDRKSYRCFKNLAEGTLSGLLQMVSDQIEQVSSHLRC